MVTYQLLQQFSCLLCLENVAFTSQQRRLIVVGNSKLDLSTRTCLLKCTMQSSVQKFSVMILKSFPSVRDLLARKTESMFDFSRSWF